MPRTHAHLLDALQDVRAQDDEHEHQERQAAAQHQLRGGKDNDPRFGERMTGTGLFADLIGQRFAVACRRLGLNGRDSGGRESPKLDMTIFRPPSTAAQMNLF